MLLIKQDEIQFILNLRQMIKYQNILQYAIIITWKNPIQRDNVSGELWDRISLSKSHISVEKKFTLQSSILI